MTRPPARFTRAASLALSLALTLPLGSLLTSSEHQQPSAPAQARIASAAPSANPSTTRAPRRAARRPHRRLSSGCGLGRRGVPRCGALLGAAHGANSNPAHLERRIGRRLGVRRTYWRADQVGSAVRTARADLRAGRLPWMSFKLPASWKAMNSAWGSTWARGVARRLGRLPGPVWVAFHHEPEYDGNIQAWKRMQERFIPAVRREASNVAFTVVLTGWHQFYGSQRFRLRRMFPRGAVDVVGFDIYNKYGVVKDGRRNTSGTDLDRSYFKKINRFAKRRGVAWGLAETGYADAATHRYPRWITKTYRTLRRRGGVAYSYFDTTLNSVADWDLSRDVKRRDFRRALHHAPLFPRW